MTHVTFVHGIGNKPEPRALLDLWRRKLAQGAGAILTARGSAAPHAERFADAELHYRWRAQRTRRNDTWKRSGCWHSPTG